MKNSIYHVGDLVALSVPPSEVTPDMPVNGTEAEVIGFGVTYVPRVNNNGLRPGVYRNRSVLVLQEQGGKRTWQLSNQSVYLLDADLCEERLAETASAVPVDPANGFLRDLPDAPFWEDDIVQLSYLSGGETFVVQSVDYAHFDGVNPDPEAASIRVSLLTHVDNPFASFEAAVTDLRLVERGKARRHFDGEVLQFGTLREEAEFHARLGLFSLMTNPSTLDAVWQCAELMTELEKGRLHFFISCNCGQSHFGGYRFHNADLGRRYAATEVERLRRLHDRKTPPQTRSRVSVFMLIGGR